MSASAFHPEDKARSLIDRQLLASGWLTQSREEMNLGAGLGVAVREFQTASGPIDYALFVDRRLCGVIEAKPQGTTLSGFSEQAARIADVPKHLVRAAGQVRFEYVASGVEILFRDHNDPDPVSRRVFAFHRPETLDRWLKEPATIRRRLQVLPPVVTEGLPILFLADRANLVRQTRDEYLAYRPPGRTGRFRNSITSRSWEQPGSTRTRRSSSPPSSASTPC